jgi:hypothetical protein
VPGSMRRSKGSGTRCDGLSMHSSVRVVTVKLHSDTISSRGIGSAPAAAFCSK